MTPDQPGRASARQSTLRATNLAVVAAHAVAAPSPVSRADIAAATGMTRSTASRLVDELVADGVLAELPPVTGSGPGRPAIPLTVARGSFVALGLEVNVSHLAVRAVDLSGEVLAERIVHHDLTGSDPARVLARLAELLTAVASVSAVRAARLVGASLALPGLVSDGVLLRAPNLGWDGVRPAGLLAPALDALGTDLVLGNEADLGALAASRTRPGAPGALSSFLYLSGENGIGAGIVEGGQLATGTRGFAGEIGHLLIDPEGPECSCGNRGCLERFAGRRVILAAAGLPEDAEPAELLARWEAGDPAARTAVSAAAEALGVALGAAINLMDIPAVVLGGHLGPLTGVLRPELEAALDRRVLASRWSTPTITAAPPDEAPGATGAAWSVLERVITAPADWLEPTGARRSGG
ncbi:ROK family transcriptional regulator [Actinomyces radicidentis]|uniref:ROK family transcriptional regulator n=1 Tax=Actinomyces radicidentis TaxID=111015 RepID=UPI0026DF7AFA|nr:ROK family transcriptional regulator [Actinomyces radicidentis]